ncbi:MAG: hypothetical protein PVF47_15805, partial [Anaerolineae bacterium]
ALYTHYFAFFLLVFQAIYLLLAWWSAEARPWQTLVGGLGAGLLVVLAFVPWLPHLLTRYEADVSYWPGRLKLSEIVVDMAVSFAGGESVTERTGMLLALGYFAVLGLSLVVLVWRAAREGGSGPPPAARRLPPAYHVLLFLLLYLLLPPALILALSYNSPKFNARYVMIAQPALLLLLAGGLAALWERRASSIGNILRGSLSLLALLYLLGAAAYADYNAYVDPAFARADFRGVVRYLRRQVGPQEAVILTSGHAFPVFDYYGPDVERHLLPDSPTLDVTRTLDYSIAGALNEWLAGKEGVWLVLWQDEVVDPAGFLTAMLAELGQEQPVDRSFAQVEVRHFRLPEGAVFAGVPAIDHPVEVNFGNRLRLQGYTQSDDQEVTLFWEALAPLEEDYRVSLILRDTQGQSWGRWDGRPAAYFYPTDRWRVGQTIFGRYDLALLPGAPPGDYGLEVGVYTEGDPAGLDVLDPSGAPQGKRAMLGAVQLSVPAVRPGEIEVPNRQRIEVGGGLALLGWELARDEAQPGDRLLLTLFWGVESRPEGDYRVQVWLADTAGQTLYAGTFRPTNAWHPTSIWLPGQAWRGQITFRLPIEAQAGEGRLMVQVVDRDGNVLGSPARLGAVQVLPTERLFTAPRPRAPRQANFDDRILLVGADLAPDPVAPNSLLQVTLYWQARAEMDVPYTVFVHLLGQDGQVVAGHDGEPALGQRPTTGWVPGEYVVDSHELVVPADLPPGDYVVEVGLYDAGMPQMPRLPVLDVDGRPETDRVIFAIAVR